VFRAVESLDADLGNEVLDRLSSFDHSQKTTKSLATTTLSTPAGMQEFRWGGAPARM
jgi:hypothetical protein